MKEVSDKRLHAVQFYLCELFRIGQSVETEGKLLPQAGREEEWGMTANRYEVSLRSDDNVLKFY